MRAIIHNKVTNEYLEDIPNFVNHWFSWTFDESKARVFVSKGELQSAMQLVDKHYFKVDFVVVFEEEVPLGTTATEILHNAKEALKNVDCYSPHALNISHQEFIKKFLNTMPNTPQETLDKITRGERVMFDLGTSVVSPSSAAKKWWDAV